jgi:hypothetical protein
MIESREQRAESREQRAESRAESREQRAESREQRRKVPRVLFIMVCLISHHVRVDKGLL